MTLGLVRNWTLDLGWMAHFFYSGRNIHIVTPGTDAGYQVIDGLGQADLYPPLWLGFQGNHYRSLEVAEHLGPEETSDQIPENEETLSANEFNCDSTLSVDEEAISSEQMVITREVEQERQNIEVMDDAYTYMI